MRFPPSLLEEIRARLPVSSVVGRRVKLTKAGREFKGLSPFNAEKSPSFFVNDQKGFYHDFSSGKHGDIFSFLIETEGLSFPEAVERLASEAGVVLPKLSEEAVAQETRAKGLVDVMGLAQQFFAEQLRGRAGGKARAYLEGRGLGVPVWDEFGLGYAPDERFALRDYLASKNVTSDAMIEAGLLIAGDDIPVPYDRFRGRVMFPIHDVRGRVIAFGGRALEKDVPAKYLNSPDTPLFHKGRVLYNHHRARKAAHDKGTVIAVEGYVDVIAMARAGFANSVAPLGTALTEEQLQLLWRMADEPILCFDGDKAGKRAAWRAVDVAMPFLQAGKSLRFALLPEGQDPDDLARSGGAQAIEAVIDRAMPLVDMVWTRALELSPTDTPERRAAFEKKLRETLQAIPDESLRRFYREDMDRRLREMFSPQQNTQRQNTPYPPRMRGGRYEPPKPGRSIREPIRTSESLARTSIFSSRSAIPPREAFILTELMDEPERLAAYSEDLTHVEFHHRDCAAVARFLIDYLAHAEAGEMALDGAALESELARQGLTEMRGRLVAALPPETRRPTEGPKKADRDYALKQALTLHRRFAVLNKELRAAEQALSDHGTEADFALLAELRAQLSALDGTEADAETIEDAATGT